MIPIDQRVRARPRARAEAEAVAEEILRIVEDCDTWTSEDADPTRSEHIALVDRIAACVLQWDRVHELDGALQALYDEVSAGCPLGDAAAGDIEHAYAWERRLAPLLDRARAVLSGEVAS